MNRSKPYFCGAAVICALLALTVPGCKKNLDEPSTHLVPAAKMWQVKNDARSAVFATYGLFRAALADNNAYLAYGELRGDDFVSTAANDLGAVISNNLNVRSDRMDEWKNWRRFYAAIAQANSCLANLHKVRENDFRYTENELSLDLANVRFIRALAYFYLVRIWGDVPLITADPDGSFKPVARSSQQEVLDFAAAEALKAAQDLPWKYDGSFPEQKDNYWGQSASYWKAIIAAKGTCYDLLAHIAAWQGHYLDAEQYTRMITDYISLSGYDWSYTSTVTNPNGGAFQGQSDDIIFFLPFLSDYQESSREGHIEEWALSEPYIPRKLPDIYVPNDTILGIFNERSDERFSVDSSGVGTGDFFTGYGKPVPVFSKIRQVVSTDNVPMRYYQSGIILFRYEELELLRAEALLFIGKTADAVIWLDAVRTRRGLKAYDPAVNGPLEDAILQERRRELIGEAWRWYDLKRFGKTAAYTGLSPAALSQGALYWPVADQLLQSGVIQQNPYWKN